MTDAQFTYLKNLINNKSEYQRTVKFQGILSAALTDSLVMEQISKGFMKQVIFKIRLNKTYMSDPGEVTNCTAMYLNKNFIKTKACSVLFYEPEMTFNQLVWNEKDQIYTDDI